MKRTRKIKLLSCLLAILMLLGAMPLHTVAVGEPQQKPISILQNGEEIEQLMLCQDDKITLHTATTLEGALQYRWQILTNTNAPKWVNISGMTQGSCRVSYALVGNMLDDLGQTQLRCTVSNGTDTYVSDPVHITVSYTARGTGSATLYAARPAAAMLDASDALATASEVKDVYSIIINYVYTDGSIAREPNVLSIAAGTSVSHTIPNPVVVGYDAVLQEAYENVSLVEEREEDGSVTTGVKLSYAALDGPKIINVIYEPAIVTYTVHHYRQNLLDDNYEADPFIITTGEGRTGEIVADCHIEIEGFHALYYERMTIAADKSTVVKIYYDRNYYLVDFDLDGGYGLEPIYTRYGSEISINKPTRPGYDFTAWTLLDFNGNPPTSEEIGKYLFTESKTSVTVDGALSYRAIWQLGYTTYTLVFWKENADDNGYSYWGSLTVDADENGNKLQTGTTVDATDWISRVSTIDDEQYFTYNETRSDHGVELRGDGSTIVNAYYLRNRYTITFYADGLCALDQAHQHAADCYIDVCGKQHIHSASCERNLTCDIPEHTEHTSECIDCGVEEHIHGVHCDGALSCGKVEHTHSSACCILDEHTHGKSCYPNVGDAVNAPDGSGWPYYNSFPSNRVNGYIYSASSFYGARYYIHISGQWYRYNTSATNGAVISPTCNTAEHTHDQGGCTYCDLQEHIHTDKCVSCDKTEHIHSDACYKDQLHTHGVDCYEYPSCEQHVHEDACMHLVCAMPTGHTHTTACNSASRESAVKLVTRKYQQSLADIWPVTDDNGNVYDEGQRWKPSDSSYYTQVLVYISSMPADDFSLTLDESVRDTYTMHYMLEVLPGEAYTHEYNGKCFVEDFQVKANYNHITKSEDFFDIKGFAQYGSSPAFSGTSITINGGGDVYFYYQRNTGNDVVLEFYNINDVVQTHSGGEIMYGAPLGDYRYDGNGEVFEPSYPTTFEPNAFRFDQWYTTPECFPGTEVNWDTLTMPDGSLALYAHWIPVFHTVKIYKDASLAEQLGDTITVEHGTFLPDPGHPTNGQLIFSGWFYKDQNGTEKAFIFNGIPVKDSIDIYAKWGSRVAVKYTLYYKTIDENGNEVEVAPPTEGSTIAGQNRTFTAKGGEELYAAYREGYFPTTASHSVVMSAETVNEYTFLYEKKGSAPYTVRYVEDKTGNVLAADKVVDDNRLSVVTETFVAISGYMPDSYQKRLVVSANAEENVLTFYYTKDETHAYYRVVHYWQNLDGQGYTEHSYSDIKATIGATCGASPILITGFTFKQAEVDGVSAALNSDGSVTATLDADGMLIAFYYDRQIVEYTVEYVEYGDASNQLAASQIKTGIYGDTVEESALDLSDKGYTRVSAQVQSLVLKETGRNVITFTYQEKTVNYQYITVIDGVTDPAYGSENVKALTGTPQGFTPILSADRTFEGWYKDAACTQAVDPATDPVTVAPDGKLTPQQTDGIYVGAVYYAKFTYNYATLTINVTGAADDEQAFLFLVESVNAGENVSLTVAVKGNSSVTLDEVAIGEYRITQLTGWSWRYDPDGGATATASVVYQGANTVTFNQTVQNQKWLNGSGYTQILIP